MTVAVPRSRRVLESESIEDDCTPGGTRLGRGRTKWLDWRRQCLSVSPLAALEPVRENAWAIHRPADLARDYLTCVMSMPSHEQVRDELKSVTHLCGDRGHLTAWLKALRIHQYREAPRDGGVVAVETGRTVLEAIREDKLAVAREVVETTLIVAPHSGLLRLLEVWLLALDAGLNRGLSRSDAQFVLESIPLKARTHHRLRGFLLREGPAPGMNSRALAKSALRRL